MTDRKYECQYCPPCILSMIITPDITKCMQSTGGIEPRSTFHLYKSHKAKGDGEISLPPNPNVSSTDNSTNLKNSKPSPSILLALIIILTYMYTGLSYSSEIPILIPQRHPVINEIVDGINKGFEELGYNSSDVQTIVMDGQGVSANYSTIIDAAIQKQPPLIISITTGLSKIAVDKISDRIPVVFSGVTDPVGANIVPDFVKHGKVTGTSDLWPIEEQLKLIRRILPEANVIGIIFKPSEANSQFGMRIVRDVAKKINLNIVERGVEDSREVVAVLDAILPQVDAIYIGPDNMTIELAKAIVENSTHAKKPVFGGEPGTLEKGAIGVISIQYFDLGRETAKLCAKILKGTPTEQIPVYVAEQGFVELNYEAAARLNLSIPTEVRQSAYKTIGIYKEPSNFKGTISITPLVIALIVLCVFLVIWWVKRKKI